MPVSVKNIITLTLFSFILAACGKKEPALSPRQIREKADSIARSRMDKLRSQAKEDLDRRLPIEIKPKIDSFLKAGSPNETVPVFPEDNTPDDTGTTAAVPAKPAIKDTTTKR